MQSILTLQDICYSYHTLRNEIPAIQKISFTLHQGEFLSIVGPSGCGKSTLLNLICQLLQPDSGEIFYRGIPLSQDLPGRPELSGKKHSPAKKKTGIPIGYMLQRDHLLEWRTVTQNILLGLEMQKQDTKEARKKAENLLKTYQLWDFRNACPRQLSGGMRQRAALIRTLLMDPDLLLLDEPFSALDYQTRLSVSDDIYQIIRREGKSAILVTHDIAEAVSMSDRVLILSDSPARVLRCMPMVFAESSATPLEKRSLPEFNEYFNTIWRELHEAKQTA